MSALSDFDRFMQGITSVVPQPAERRPMQVDVPWRSPVDQRLGEAEMEAHHADRAARMREGIYGAAQAIDQLGSAFDQRLSRIAVPVRPQTQWRPNVNPGIAGMVQQLLLAANRY